MNYRETVVAVAKQFDKLEADDQIAKLDSLLILEFAEELEKKTGLTIPTELIKVQNFSSVAQVVEILENAKR